MGIETDEIENNLRRYCAMWPDRALALLDQSLGNLIPAASSEAFFAQGLLVSVSRTAQLTEKGRGVLARVNRILSGTFLPPPSPWVGLQYVQLSDLKPAAAARTGPAKAQRLRKDELRALKEILLRPGQAYGVLEASCSAGVLQMLRMAQLISEGTDKYAQITPTAKAETVMLLICQELFALPVGRDAAAESA